MNSLQAPFIVAMLVPTGVGASIGGFAGDATPAMNLLASVCDVLITHPNVANAAIFQKLPDHALYVEGYALDRFFKGEWCLQPVRANRIGVLIDSGIDPEMKTLHLNVIRAVQAVYGIDVVAMEETTAPIEIAYGIGLSGCSSGALKNPDTLLQAARKLLERGATAIALCVHFAEDHTDDATEDAYRQTGGVDPVGGVEAILSHTIVSELKIPCANSPVFPKEAAMPEFGELVDPRAAAEYIAPTFLPCVLQGLSKSPRIITSASNAGIESAQLNALVVPVNALGGVPVLAALAQGIPVIAVLENETVCDITPEQFAFSRTPIYAVQTYLEAAGVLQALKQGIALETLNLQPVNMNNMTGHIAETVQPQLI